MITDKGRLERAYARFPRESLVKLRPPFMYFSLGGRVGHRRSDRVVVVVVEDIRFLYGWPVVAFRDESGFLWGVYLEVPVPVTALEALAALEQR